MALGGGIFVTQNKTLPGSYINFVSASKATATLGERGVVAIALPLGKSTGEVITVTKADPVAPNKGIATTLPTTFISIPIKLIQSRYIKLLY